MENKAKLIKEDYSKHLRPHDYVDTLENEWYKEDEAFLRLPLTFFHDCLRSGRFKGSKLLDIGSGAVVHNIASASAFFPNIVMSDYVEHNCQELRKWLSRQSTLKQFLDIPAELEGYRGNLASGKELLENRIRKSVKQVVRCDVLTDGILIEEVNPDVGPPYDLVISSLALEAAALDFDSFVDVLKRINKLLRPAGGLMLVGFLDGEIWRVKQNHFHHIQISEEDLRKALKESGFGNLEFKAQKVKIDYGHDKLYCLAAEKL